MTYKSGLWTAGPSHWLPGLVAWLDCRTGITLAPTLRVRSTSTPPTIASASSLAQVIPVWGKVQNAGVVGAGATIDASSNSGAYRSLRGAVAGLLMALAGTDCTLSFTGTLTANDVFETVVASITDQIGGFVFTSLDQAHSPGLETRGAAGTGNQNIFTRDLFGCGLTNLCTLQAQGCHMTNTTLTPSVFVTGQSFAMFVEGRLTGGLALGNQGSFVGGGANSTTDATNNFTIGHDGAGHLNFVCRNTAGNTTTITQSSGPATNHSDFTMAVRYDKATEKISLWRMGVKIAADVTPTTGTLGAINWSIISLLARRRRALNTPIDDTQINGCLHAVGFVNRAPSDAEMYDFMMLMAGRPGIIEPKTDGDIKVIGDSNATPATNTNWPAQMKWGVDALATGSSETPNLQNFASSGNGMVGDPNNPADNTGALGGFQLAQLQAAFVGGGRDVLINACSEVNIGVDGTGNLATLIANTNTWLTKVLAMGYPLGSIIWCVFPYAAPAPATPIAPAFLTKQQAWADYLYTVAADPRLVVDFRAIGFLPNDNDGYLDQQHLASNGSIRAGNLLFAAYQFAVHGA